VKEKVAVATVEGKAYFLIVNQFREQNILFESLVPGEPVPLDVKVVITTGVEKHLVNFEKTLIFHDESELDKLVSEVKIILRGKQAYEKIVIGIDPGEVIGLAAIADGNTILETNCFNIKEVISCITKMIRNFNFLLTKISIKIGNGVAIYKELLKALDEALPPEIMLEVVGEAGTNKPLKENKRSRRIRHICSAIRIAGRKGDIIPRSKTIATNSRIQ
jgi:hypothetical protein